MAKSSKTDEIRKLLGQSFFIGFEGVEVPSEVSKFISENKIGGVTLFANNYESPAQVAELTNSLQILAATQSEDSLPMFIAVDHEGGRVQRFKKPFTRFPSAGAIGELDSAKLAFEIASAQAKELKAVGINVNYAPVADINTNSKNPVIGDRSFGSTEERVSKMISGFIRGYLTNGIQPVLKHFPGHGDTTQDSHFHLPQVTTSIETLQERELKPFVKGFKSGCEIVMTAHILLSKYEPKIPCTLSKKVLQTLLREELRFKGLIFSDDMEMKAIADNFGKADAALMAIEAGCDALLYHTMPFAIEVFEPLLSKLTSPEGKNALESLKISNSRLTEFKKKNFLPYKPIYIPEIEHIVGSKEHQEILKSTQS